MIRSDIQKIIDEDINPGLAAHGGYITIHDFVEEHKSLKLTMGGGCHGCASSKISMVFAAERHLREVFPEDVTKHSEGEAPYYSSEER
jgi:Fe-S cluster biogenesis protein NfuA